MKIAILSNFSYPSICGVWFRAKNEAELLSKYHEVRVFSSNWIKGTKDRSGKEDRINKIKIQRFPAVKFGGESFLYWNFKKEILKFKPDVIIAHSYRQIHTIFALIVAKKLKCKVFLVTHAPFVEGNITRTLPSKIAVILHDLFLAPLILNKFDKVIAITKWEIPILTSMRVKQSKIAYIPNGIPEEFFTQKKTKEQNKILFLGRIAPIKNIETLIKAFSLLKEEDINLEIVGPAEEDYLKKLKLLIQEMVLKRRSPLQDLYTIQKKKLKR